MRRTIGFTLAVGLVASVHLGCGSSSSTSTGEGSEIATSVVSGALNNTGGSLVGWNGPAEKRSIIDRVLDTVDPIGTAWGATWSCTGGTLSPTFAGPASNPYSFTPVSCTVGWRNGKSTESSWSGAFVLNYGSSCDAHHVFLENQAGSCSLTRTTAAGGNIRSLTGPDGGVRAVTHDTNGAGTGWDTSISPTNGGIVVTCAAAGCSTGRNVVVSGSHLTATVTPAGGTTSTLWNHTVTSDGTGIAVTGSGTSRVATGSITVQHNLAKFTSTSAFNSVGYGDPGCCFPTTGSVTTSFSGGPDDGKSETLTFSALCGEATLTDSSGATSAMTLQHCI